MPQTFAMFLFYLRPIFLKVFLRISCIYFLCKKNMMSNKASRALTIFCKT